MDGEQLFLGVDSNWQLFLGVNGEQLFLGVDGEQLFLGVDGEQLYS